MPDVKSISHQSIHTAQAPPAESSKKTSEIVKESKPVEERTLTMEQQQNIKQSRTAESKLAESAIRAFLGPAPKETPAESHVNQHELEAEWPEIMSKVDADAHVYEHEFQAWAKEHPAEHHVLQHSVESLNAKGRESKDPVNDLLTPAPGQLPTGTGPLGKFPSLDDLKSAVKNADEYLKPLTDVQSKSE